MSCVVEKAFFQWHDRCSLWNYKGQVQLQIFVFYSEQYMRQLHTLVFSMKDGHSPTATIILLTFVVMQIQTSQLWPYTETGTKDPMQTSRHIEGWLRFESWDKDNKDSIQIMK